MNRNKIQSTEKPGVAVCGESRKHGFEWECREVILGSTPNDYQNVHITNDRIH